jgi:flagellar motor protein MotB
MRHNKVNSAQPQAAGYGDTQRLAPVQQQSSESANRGAQVLNTGG